MTAAPAAGWVREFALVGLRSDRAGTLRDLCRVLGQAVDARGAVLWEAVEPADEPAALSMLSLWTDRSEPAEPARRGRSGHPDRITETAFRERSLAIPADGEPDGRDQLLGMPICAALPVDYADGGLGVLTLLGCPEFGGEAFDTAVELVAVLPHLCSTIRERHTLALVHACNTILQGADLESPDRPLSRERLRECLARLCALVAEAVQCAQVAIFLRESPAESEPALFAGSGPAPQWPVDHGDRAGVGYHPEPSMWVPLKSGEHVLGVISCHGAVGPPYHFTRSDLPLLEPIAAQVAQFWRNWLFRQASSQENDSWRQLAAGVTAFNRLLSEQLRSHPDHGQKRDPVAAAALAMLRDVVPETSGALEVRAVQQRGAPVRFDLGETLLSGASPGSPLVDEVHHRGATPTERVFRSRRPEGTTDAGEIARAGLGPDVGWLLCTPIRVGEKAYGVLEGFGPAPVPPENSTQVYEIVSDQLGLYRHLQHTLGRLREAREHLQVNLKTQADTMEDLKHQLVSPLRTATDRTDLVLRSGRFDQRAEAQLKAVRGLCRKASRVAMSAGVFAVLSKDQKPTPKCELTGVDDLLRLLIAAADDAQVLSNPRRGVTFDVDRESVRQLGRRLVDIDASFLQQCVGNVLDNASKYSFAGTVVRIGATVGAGELMISVTNTGLALDPEDATRCLTRNWRGVAARNTTGEGSGIGLWIVDHLIRSMKGCVKLHPEGDVTVVQLHLPLA